MPVAANEPHLSTKGKIEPARRRPAKMRRRAEQERRIVYSVPIWAQARRAPIQSDKRTPAFFRRRLSQTAARLSVDGLFAARSREYPDRLDVAGQSRGAEKPFGRTLQRLGLRRLAAEPGRLSWPFTSASSRRSPPQASVRPSTRRAYPRKESGSTSSISRPAPPRSNATTRSCSPNPARLPGLSKPSARGPTPW